MKKLSLITTLAVFVLVALLSALPSSAAQAAEPATISLFVHNSSGGTVSMVLTDQLGFHFTFTYAPGMTSSKLKEGKYTYYANTPCGVEAGSFNLNRSKKLELFCNKEGQEITLSNTFQQSCELMLKAPAYGDVRDSKLAQHPGPIWFYFINFPSSIPFIGGILECYDGVTPIIDFNAHK